MVDPSFWDIGLRQMTVGRGNKHRAIYEKNILPIKIRLYTSTDKTLKRVFKK
jgi:hypothetical protein